MSIKEALKTYFILDSMQSYYYFPHASDEEQKKYYLYNAYLHKVIEDYVEILNTAYSGHRIHIYNNVNITNLNGTIYNFYKIGGILKITFHYENENHEFCETHLLVRHIGFL